MAEGKQRAMAKNTARNNLLVGVFVLGGIAVFTIGLLFVGGKGEPFSRRVQVSSRFSSIGGLLEGAPVRLAGVDIGSVYNISFAETQTEKPVIVTIEISSSAADRIGRDAKAQIRQLGLLGDKYIEILQGNLQLGTIREAQYIEGQAPFDIGEVYDQFEDIMTNIREASGKISEAVELYAQPKTAENLSRGIDAARALVEEIRDGKGFIHAIIYEDAHKGILKDLARASDHLADASLYFDDILKEVRAGKGSLHTLVYGEDLAETIIKLDGLAADLQAITTQVKTGDGLAHRMFYDEGEKVMGADLARTVAELRTASADIAQVSRALREGEGTLGALIQDKALYEDIRLLFGGAGRSSWLRYVIRSMVEENEKRAASDQE